MKKITLKNLKFMFKNLIFNNKKITIIIKKIRGVYNNFK